LLRVPGGRPLRHSRAARTTGGICFDTIDLLCQRDHAGETLISGNPRRRQ
jgi:hypothetical protein